MRRTLAAAVFTALSIATAGAQLTIPKEYLPKVHGTIRSKYELQTTTGMQRFQVRNARVSLDGKVLPVIAYKAEIDLSDEGSIKMLDALWGIERSGFFNGREKWAKGFENQRV